MQNTFPQSGNDSKWFLTKRQYKDYLVGQLTRELWILLQGLCRLKTRRTATRRSCRCLSSRVALRGWDGWWHHSPICPTIVFHFCTTAQLHNHPTAQLHNLKPLSYTTNRKVIKHLMTKTTLLIDKFSLLVDRGGGDVRRKRWLFCGSIFFYSKCTVTIGQCCNFIYFDAINFQNVLWLYNLFICEYILYLSCREFVLLDARRTCLRCRTHTSGPLPTVEFE